MAADVVHSADIVAAVASSVDRVLGRHLGAMLSDGEADELLTALEGHGFDVVPTGEYSDLGTMVEPRARVVVNVNVSCDPATGDVGGAVAAALEAVAHFEAS